MQNWSIKDVLLSWLNDLGICFSYQGNMGVLQDLKVLRPEWVLNGVYKIINAPEVENSNGFLPHSVIRTIMERKDDVNGRYHNAERDFILEMMRKFKFSYPVGDSEFIPMLSAEGEPPLPDISQAAILELEFDKTISEAVLYQFVVEMRSSVDTERTWRHGTYLCDLNGSQAIIRFDANRRRVEFRVSKDNNQLPHIRNTFLSLLRGLSISCREYIYYTQDGKTAKLELGRQLKMLRQGKTTDFADDISEDVSICNVLACVAPIEVINVLKKQNSPISNSQFDKDVLFILADIKRQIGKMCDCIEMTYDEMRDISILCRKIVEDASYKNIPEIQQLLEDLLKEVKVGNQKEFKTKFSDFLSTANDFSSLLQAVPQYIVPLVKIIQIISGS